MGLKQAFLHPSARKFIVRGWKTAIFDPAIGFGVDNCGKGQTPSGRNINPELLRTPHFSPYASDSRIAQLLMLTVPLPLVAGELLHVADRILLVNDFIAQNGFDDIFQSQNSLKTAIFIDDYGYLLVF